MNFLFSNFVYIFYIIMYFFGLYVFVSMRKHMLITLMALEYKVLCAYMFMVFFMTYLVSDTYMLLIFMVFSVCEGVLGLSLLVYMIRCCGSDNVNHLSLLW